MLLDMKKSKIINISYSILSKCFNFWKIDDEKSLELFLEFYEKSYKKDQNNLLNLIQLLQFVINEHSVQFYNYENFNKFLLISFSIFDNKNTLMKNSISLALTQLFSAYSNFLCENDNFLKKEYNKNLICFSKILQEICLQLEEKVTKSVLNDSQIFKERLILKLIFSIYNTLKDKINKLEIINEIFKKNFYNFVKMKFKYFNNTNSLGDLHYLLICTSYLVLYNNKFDLLLIISQIENQYNKKKKINLLIKEMYINIFEEEKLFLDLIDYNYLIIINILGKLHKKKKIGSEKINYKFEFYDSSYKLSFDKMEENILNLNILEKLINIFLVINQKEILIKENWEENLTIILQTMEKLLKKYTTNQLNQVSMNYRNILFQNLFKISGEISKKNKKINYKNKIIEFFNKEITSEENQNKFNYRKTLNLKSLLNIGVNLNEYMNKNNWVIIIISYLKYSTDEKKIKTDELEEYFMLNNSFKSLFLASEEFDLKIIEDIFLGIKEIILFYDLLTNEYFSLLLSYLEDLVRINFKRIFGLWDFINDLFLNLIESKDEIVIKFAMEFLAFLINFIFKEFFKNEEEENDNLDKKNNKKENDNLDNCFLLLNILIKKKNFFIYNQIFQILEVIIDVNGYDLSPKFWKTILEKILKILEFFENSKHIKKNLNKNVFELIQKINANYLNFLDRECLLTFIKILKIFIKVTSSKNYKYGVIEYFYTISDNMSKKFIHDKNLWISLFSFLHTNSEEKDAEIRNTSLNIFAGIINNYGFDFSPEIWEIIMTEIYLKSFDNIIEIYFNLVREEMKIKNFSDTPNFVLDLKKDFERDKNSKKNKKPERMISPEDIQTISLQWQETIRILIQSFNRILTKYLQYKKKSKKIISKLFEKSFYLFRITSKNIFNDVTIVIKNILKSDVISNKMKKTLFLEIESWLRRNKNQGQAVHDLMNIIFGVFKDKCFFEERGNFEIILKIYLQIVFFSAFCKEYSTYFYNLEKMCKGFLEEVFDFCFLCEIENGKKIENGNEEDLVKIENRDDLVKIENEEDLVKIENIENNEEMLKNDNIEDDENNKELLKNENNEEDLIKNENLDNENIEKILKIENNDEILKNENNKEKLKNEKKENLIENEKKKNLLLLEKKRSSIKKETDSYSKIFLKYFPKLFYEKLKNKKANNISINLLKILFKKIEENLKKINFKNLEEIINSLFVIILLAEKNEYILIIKNLEEKKKEEKNIFILFYEKLNFLITKIILLKKNKLLNF